MGDIAGATFAGHEVRDVIGTDLVSTLYRATVPDEDRTVSLRIVAHDLCVVEGPDRQLYRRFREQATASLTFEHPFSPTVEEVGEHHGQGYLIAPFVDAIPLSSFVADQPRLEVGAALDLFEKVADVLDSGQQAGLTHGAVNPSTVAFARPGPDAAPDAAYLTGYGVGALLELRLKRDRKQLTVVDDLLYVAPEQLRQQTVTGRTDQYGLACALLHVLTGKPPFTRDSIGGLFGAHLFVDPELDESWPWADAVRRGMAKEPDERHATCGELIAAVRAAVASAATRVLEQPPADAGGTGAAGARRSAGPEPQAPAEQAGEGQAAAARGRDRQARPGRGRDGEQSRPELPARRRERSRPMPQPQHEPQRAPSEPAQRGASPPSQTRKQPVAVDDDVETGAERPADPAPMFAPSTPAESRNGTRPQVSWPDDEDAPLLSEVLSQHDARSRRGLRSPAGMLLLLLVVLIVAGVVAWLML